MNWKDKTCEKCVFQVGEECRRFPPGSDGYPWTKFLVTIRSYDWMKACAEYAESLDKPQEPADYIV